MGGRGLTLHGECQTMGACAQSRAAACAIAGGRLCFTKCFGSRAGGVGQRHERMEARLGCAC